MNRRLAALASLLVITGCTSPSTPPPPAAKPLVSGLELAAYDKSARPQDDLFQHVNGGWLTKTEIPADKASYGAFDMLFDKAQADLKAIVEEAAKDTTNSPESDGQKIGDFYESFMNEAKVEELGLSPLRAELAAIEGLKTKTDLARHLAHFFKLNLINPLVGYVEGDARNPREEILYVYQGGLGLPDRDYYFKTDPKLKEYREKYVAFLAEILELSGVASAPAAAREIFELETRLAKAHWTNVENRDSVRSRRTISSATCRAPTSTKTTSNSARPVNRSTRKNGA